VRLTFRLMVRARESSSHTRTYLQHIIGFAFLETVLKKLQMTIPYRIQTLLSASDNHSLKQAMEVYLFCLSRNPRKSLKGTEVCYPGSALLC